MMSLESSIVPTSLKKTVGPAPVRIGRFCKSLIFETTELIGASRSKSPVRTFPAGTMVFPVFSAWMTSSGHAVGTEAIRVNTDDNRSCGTTKGRGGGHSRQSRKQRPHTVQRKILDLRDTPRRTGKNQIADGHAACVEPHNEWGNSARRHKRAGAVDVADGLSQRLAHICFGVKRELNQADILNGFRFHGLNPGDVQEMIFVVVDEIAFHLRSEEHTSELQS